MTKIVYVMPTNSIGVVLDEGKEHGLTWYRTDCDGVRDEHELLFLGNLDAVKAAMEAGAMIAPSTKQMIGL